MSREILNSIINDFQVENFTRFFREKNRSFAPRKEDMFQYNDDDFKNGVMLGEIQFNPPSPPFDKGGMGGFADEKLLICAFEASQPLIERSGKKAQYEKGKKILKEANADAGIFIFYSDSPLKRGDMGASSFRFSLIYPEYVGTKRQWSYFKRFTYYVSPELTNKTFLQQIGDGDFSSLQKIKQAFSVDPVTKQFYSELQSWYFWAMDKIKFPDDYKYSSNQAKDKEIRNATNLIRLITRIIFIWFLAEKGLVHTDLFSREKLARIVKDFMNGKKALNFYNAILQNLFFGTLNQRMDERKFADERGYPANKKEYGVKNLYRYADKFLIEKNEVLELFKHIPFLNGGLFDCLDKEDESGKVVNIDGFSRNPAKQTNIPDYLFFQQAEERVDLSAYGLGSNRSIRGLIEILNTYNFTIDENTPVDQEIALDPELLGKVFENLLASYNPETATTARKATGSYYTPREIVDYMVGESLVAYLTTALNNTPQPPLKLRGGEGGVMLPSPLAGEGMGEGGFDIVIGNPPYVSVKSISSVDKSVLSKEFDTGQGRFNLFTLFLEKGHKLLSLNGILTFIVPEGIYSHVEYRHTRNYLLNNSEIILVNLFSEKVFEAAVDTTILSIKNGECNQERFCIYRDLQDKVFEVNQNLFLTYPFNLFAVNLTSQTFNIINRFLNNNSFDILENILEIQQGIIYSGQPKNKVFANLPKDKTFKKVLDGRDILKWRINWDNKIDNKYIAYTDRLHRPREERLFLAKEKILLPRKSIEISCAYDDTQFYALNTAYICLSKNTTYNLKYILSLLNSKFINFFYSSLFFGWQITIPALNSLPIKKIDESAQ